MFEKDAFEKRERAVEDEFFHRVDEQLKEDLRKSLERDRSRESLSSATGLTDPVLLDALLDAGFQATTLTALALVPVVFVAWADHHVTDSERKEVMKAAEQRGIDEDALAGKLLRSWLDHPPKKALWETWKSYASAVNESLPAAATGMLSENILQIARTVAEASGGVLGFGKVSENERQVLDEIKATLG